MHSTDSRVLREQSAEGVLSLTLNRPDKRNALDAATIHALGDALAAAESDDSVRVILLAGAGPDFCAGADLAQLEAIAAGSDPMQSLADAGALGDLFSRMRAARMPIVAAVQGNAIAGGAGLATAADLIVASQDATFGYPEVHLGFVPAMVMALLRRGVGEKVAFDLAAGGHRFDATEARRLGLVARVFPADSFAADALAFATTLASRSASALHLIKRLLYGMDGMPFDDAVRRGAEVNVIARGTPDCRDGVRRFLDRRRD